MTDNIVTLRGIKVKGVPDDWDCTACAKCVFTGDCVHISEEHAAGVACCAIGDHYYVEVADAKD
jgi:hypothetical protein